MCLIIARPAGSPEIPKEYIREAGLFNNDGFGIVGKDAADNMWLDKTLVMSKAEELIRLAESKDMNFIAHFRIRTAGRSDLDNCHPFRLHGANYLAHNGIVHIDMPVMGMSDTWHMVQKMKQEAVTFHRREQVTKAFIRKWFAKYEKELGGNRFALLGEHIPLSTVGHWEKENGVYYSNSSYKPYRPRRAEITTSGTHYFTDSEPIEAEPVDAVDEKIIQRAQEQIEGWEIAQERAESNLFTKWHATDAELVLLDPIDKKYSDITRDLEELTVDADTLDALKGIDPEAWNTLYAFYADEINEIYNFVDEEEDEALEKLAQELDEERQAIQAEDMEDTTRPVAQLALLPPLGPARIVPRSFPLVDGEAVEDGMTNEEVDEYRRAFGWEHA